MRKRTAASWDEALVRAFERPSNGTRFDETDVNLRAYVARIPPEKLAGYEPSWSDAEVMAWDGNFREDGDLMLVCCERDVDVGVFRTVVEECQEAGPRPKAGQP